MNKYRITNSDLSYVKYFTIEEKYRKEERVKFNMAMNTLYTDLYTESNSSEYIFIDKYSGLLDRYGNEIYDNDIIITPNEEGVFKVVFMEGCFLIKIYKDIITHLYELSNNSIVIGNVHFNKSLVSFNEADK